MRHLPPSVVAACLIGAFPATLPARPLIFHRGINQGPGFGFHVIEPSVFNAPVAAVQNVLNSDRTRVTPGTICRGFSTNAICARKPSFWLPPERCFIVRASRHFSLRITIEFGRGFDPEPSVVMKP